MKVVILGAGIGGKIISKGLKNNFSNIDVTLVGPESPEPGGLFYFNKEIPGITGDTITVSYDKTTDCESCESYKIYQYKSRGEYNPEITISSLNKVGTEEVGYLLSNDFNLNDVKWIKSNCIEISNSRIITLEGVVPYDYIISTIPLPILVKLVVSGSNLDFKYRGIYIKEKNHIKSDFKNLNYIKVLYDLTSSPYYRHSYYFNKDLELIKEVSETLINNKECTSYIRYGKILPPDDDIIKYRDIIIPEKLNFKIKCFGRYAKWDYHYTVDQSYFDAMNWIDYIIKKEKLF